MKKYIPVTVLMLVLMSFSACKKDSTAPGPGTDEDKDEILVKEDTLKDSVFYYTKLLSLWQDYLPPRNLNDIEDEELVRSYTRDYESAEDVLEWLKDLTRAGSTGKNYDWYSFLDRQGVVSGEIQDAVATSFGMYVFFLQTESSGENADLYVQMVDYKSPAYNAGIRRGTRILSIDGDTNIDYDTQFAQDFRKINEYLNASSLQLKFVKADGTVEEKEVGSVQYDFDPILDHQVITQEGKKIGYLAFSSFVSTISDQGAFTTMYRRFEDIFNGFQNEGIDELVIDMRYNGGGAVVTSEYLADRIAPISADKQLMYEYKTNTLLDDDWQWLEQDSAFGPVHYRKRGTINLPRVYFIVSSSTASASELLINSLRPYMDVKLLSTYSVDNNNQQVAEKTFGKPVGFFGLPIMDDDIELYVSSFKTQNAQGEGDYFEGLEVDDNVWEFNSFEDFGDKDESMLAAVLQHIKTGSFDLSASKLVAARNGQIRPNKAKFTRSIDQNRSKNGMYKFSKSEMKLK
ncbi:MAG: S41 family peptidase [Sphingobacterium sp.]|uniref:S41 family peptidase n=1 Tax=Sphingobacterium sp. JB170 TaxID=1434842 RepID=UPI00097EBF1D|nr:S41 family peptidase [Sphingobacterium sp. JB170]SJN32774.1 Carboxyl-terminal protease [Sphingobacterium sp. JB170]